MSKLEIHQIAVLNDNYVYLAHDAETGATAVVDPAVGGPVLDALTAKSWKLTHILNTHPHADHTGANLTLQHQTDCI
ncbi:MAG: MBL fold metallo-hydrolase, partial [Rhodospirillales bacterium]